MELYFLHETSTSGEINRNRSKIKIKFFNFGLNRIDKLNKSNCINQINFIYLFLI